ncbi:DUF6907 domain-containing protein [Streptomyces sp. NPDC101455]|uniref:DUF6907 domain-containing protein n=1 Tax=Streptomyces sp. NPDC101455 TaxID=3366142 RepID=UPI0037FAAFCE
MSVTTFRSTDSTVTTPQLRTLPANVGDSERTRIDETPDDGAREHTRQFAEPLMAATVTAPPEFGLNSPELLYAEYAPDPEHNAGAEISLNSQGNGSLFAPDQASDFANTVIAWGKQVKAMARTAQEDAEDIQSELRRPAENAEYLPKLVRECERLGLALQFTDDPAVDLTEIKVIDGRRTLIARADEVPVAYDDVEGVGLCLDCKSEFDDSAILYAPANAVPGFGGYEDISGEYAKICRPCFEASGLPLTAVQRGPEWIAQYECPSWCVMDHAGADGAPGWHQGLAVKVTAPTSTFSQPSSKEPESVVLSARINQTTQDADAYGLETQIWLGVDMEILELTLAQARTLFTAMQRIMPALQSMCQQAEWLARDDYPGDPEIRARREAEQDAHAKAISEKRDCGCPRCAAKCESANSSQAA